jgi:hypothetical protein
MKRPEKPAFEGARGRVAVVKRRRGDVRKGDDLLESFMIYSHSNSVRAFSFKPQVALELVQLQANKRLCTPVSDHVCCRGMFKLDESFRDLLAYEVPADVNVLAAAVIQRVRAKGNCAAIVGLERDCVDWVA